MTTDIKQCVKEFLDRELAPCSCENCEYYEDISDPVLNAKYYQDVGDAKRCIMEVKIYGLYPGKYFHCNLHERDHG